jgi:tetratricopeptide (TPR) repeat protein
VKKRCLLGLIPLVALLSLGASTGCNLQAAGNSPSVYADSFRSIQGSDTLSGNYLAGRFAQSRQDWDAAQGYMNKVTAFDNGNAALEQRVFLLSLGAGEFSVAKELAEKISTQRDDAELAIIFLTCEALARKDYTAALDVVAKLPEDGFGEYTKPLLTAWALVGMGQKDKAIEHLRLHADPSDPTYNVHAGLIEEFSGNKAAAAVYFRTASKNGLTLHTAIMLSDFFERNNDPVMVRSIRSSIDRMYSFSPFATGKPTDAGKTSVSTAAEGASVALFDLASLLYERRAYDSAQIYGALVKMLAPESHFAALMLGDIAALGNHYGKAIGLYDGIPQASPLFWLSRMRVAEVYEATDRIDLAAQLLSRLTDRPATRLQAFVSLGDLHRRHENFPAAIAAYDAAMAGVKDVTPEYWSIIYARGMSLERNNDWSRAERDLLAALAFQPENPAVLNYIGYSWLEKDINLDRALEFTKKAAELRPDDGYIVDSYGWALYRNGMHAEAVEWLERAVELVPDDSTVLDHLADAYWQAGRKNEARFKWRRAAEVSTDAAFKAGIQRKIASGIAPAVQQAAQQVVEPQF